MSTAKLGSVTKLEDPLRGFGQMLMQGKRPGPTKATLQRSRRGGKEQTITYHFCILTLSCQNGWTSSTNCGPARRLSWGVHGTAPVAPCPGCTSHLSSSITNRLKTTSNSVTRADSSHHRRGGEFQALFHWHVADLGMEHVYIEPRTPQLNGKVERSHRTDKDEFYQLLTYQDDVALEKKLAVWERFYNFNRPYGTHGGKTPYEALGEKLS